MPVEGCAISCDSQRARREMTLPRAKGSPGSSGLFFPVLCMLEHSMTPLLKIWIDRDEMSFGLIFICDVNVHSKRYQTSPGDCIWLELVQVVPGYFTKRFFLRKQLPLGTQYRNIPNLAHRPGSQFEPAQIGGRLYVYF